MLDPTWQVAEWASNDRLDVFLSLYEEVARQRGVRLLQTLSGASLLESHRETGVEAEVMRQGMATGPRGVCVSMALLPPRLTLLPSSWQ